MRKYNLELINKLLEKKETRIALLQKDLFLFSIYYFTDIFTHKASDFQKELCYDLDKDLNLLIIWYRWSAKTTFTIIKIIQNICYNKSKFIMFFCAEKTKSTARLYDIVVHLQTNKKIINDFWELFPKQRNKNNSWDDFSQKKSIPEFITTNQVKVKASSIWESPRWEIFFNWEWSFRPDLVVLDDIDTEKTVYNINMIDKNYKWIKWELFGSLQKEWARIIFLWNIIKTDWIVPRFEKDYISNIYWKTLRKALIENWKITWDFFTHEDIEKIRNEQWEIAFNQNYMLIPYSWWDTIIKRHHIKYYRENIIFDKIVIWVDPAISEKTKSDPFAICVTGIKWDNYYIIESIELEWEQKDPFKATQIVKQLYLKYNANKVIVETIAFQQVMSKLFKQEWIATEETKPHKDKITRVMEKQYLFEQGKVYFHPDNNNKLIDQLINFPNVLHDDLCDSCIMTLQENNNYFTWFF